MEYADIVSAVRQGRLAPAYLLAGSQSFMIEAVVRALRDAVEADRHGEFAAETFHAGEANGSRIAAAAREIPMLVPRRLVLVRDADLLLRRTDDWEPLAAYLDNPSPTTVLALVAEAFDGRTRLAKRILETGVVLKADKVAPRELPRFVRDHGRALGAELSAEAVDAIAEACGDDLALVHDALSKLALYVETGREATAADVEATVTPSRQRSVFELSEALGMRQPGRAFELISRLVDQGEAPLRVLGLLARAVRQLIDIKSGRRDSSRVANLPPFVRDKLEGQAARFTPRDLARALVAIRRADTSLKSSRREGERVLEALVLEIAGGAPARAGRARG